jgi:hypothetical protein
MAKTMAKQNEDSQKERNGSERKETLKHLEMSRLLILRELLISRVQIKRPLLYH